MKRPTSVTIRGAALAEILERLAAAAGADAMEGAEVSAQTDGTDIVLTARVDAALRGELWEILRRRGGH